MSLNLNSRGSLPSLTALQSSDLDYAKYSVKDRTILLIGNYRPTIPLIHEFYQLGFKIVVGVTDAPERGYIASRFVSECWAHSNSDEEPERFINELNQFLTERHDISYVMPVAEDMVTVIQLHVSKLVRSDIFVMVGSELIELCLNKAKILDFAQSADVKQAPYEVVTDYDSMLAGASEVGFPIAVRPTHSSLKFGSRKALLCENREQLETFLPSWPEGHEQLILQKQFYGRRHNLYFAARDGKLLRLLETVADRTDHIDGTGLAVKGRTIAISPALLRDTQKLLGEMNYTGIGCAQYLVSEDFKSHSFLEINPRIAGNHMLPFKAGLSLGPLFVALTQNIKFPKIDTTEMIIAEPGISYVWTYGDLGGCFREWRAGQINFVTAIKWMLTAIKDAFSADMHMTWSFKDPKPALYGYGEKLFGKFRKN